MIATHHAKVTLDARRRAPVTQRTLLVSNEVSAHSTQAAGLCSVGRLLFDLSERIDAAQELFSRGRAAHRQQPMWFRPTFHCPRFDAIRTVAHDRTRHARQLRTDHQSDPGIVEHGKRDPTRTHRLHGMGEA